MKVFVKDHCLVSSHILEVRADYDYPLDVLNERDNPQVYAECGIERCPALVKDDMSVVYDPWEILEEMHKYYGE